MTNIKIKSRIVYMNFWVIKIIPRYFKIVQIHISFERKNISSTTRSLIVLCVIVNDMPYSSKEIAFFSNLRKSCFLNVHIQSVLYFFDLKAICKCFADLFFLKEMYVRQANSYANHTPSSRIIKYM